MTTAAPQVGTKIRANTTTPSAVSVIIEVTALDGENPQGWFVWGYRQGGRNAGRRQTMYPRRYFVAKS
jgi:hypothetical protein